jgi:antitoxin VapB
LDEYPNHSRTTSGAYFARLPCALFPSAAVCNACVARASQPSDIAYPCGILLDRCFQYRGNLPKQSEEYNRYSENVEQEFFAPAGSLLDDAEIEYILSYSVYTSPGGFTMALSIRNPIAERLARDLARQTGHGITETIILALEHEKRRMIEAAQAPRAEDEMLVISRRCAKLPDRDTRPTDEILGYDKDGGLAAW